MTRTPRRAPVLPAPPAPPETEWPRRPPMVYFAPLQASRAFSPAQGTARIDEDVLPGSTDLPEAIQWHEGMLLGPHHFQQLTQGFERLLDIRINAV